MFKSKNLTKLLSLVVAILLWLYVVGVENPPTKVKVPNVPVKIVNTENLTERGLVINTENTSFVMDVLIEGSRSDVLKVKAEDITITADVFGYIEGLNSIPVMISVPDKIFLADNKPRVINIDIEKLVTVNTKVKVVYEGKPKNDREPTILDLTPEEVEIKGPESQVFKVSTVEAAIDAAQLGETSRSFNAEIVAKDNKGIIMDSVSLSSNSITIEAAAYKTKEVPLEVVFAEDIESKYQIEDVRIPDRVQIKGKSVKLDGIAKLTTKPIDLSRLDSSNEIPVAVDLPEGVMLTSASENMSLSITLKGVSSREFEIPVSKITSRGIDEDKEFVSAAENVSVTVMGQESVISKMTPEDIVLYVDLTDKEVGTYSVEIKAETEKAEVSLSVDPKELYLTVRDI